jgi:hypothetical protein
MRILAIDPGNTESGYALIDHDTCWPLDVGKISNPDLHARIKNGSLLVGVDQISIEMIASYGMAVGKEVFETCVWIGRFLELVGSHGSNVELIYRKDIKLHHCHTTKAKDSNITQALVDRFASGVPNHGKGSKADPGWFYGFKADIWQAYALAVYTADTLAVDVPVGAACDAREVAS